MKIAPPSRLLFWLVFQAHKQTALLIGSIIVTPLVVQHICFSFPTTVIKKNKKTCDLLCMHRSLHCCAAFILMFIRTHPRQSAE